MPTHAVAAVPVRAAATAPVRAAATSPDAPGGFDVVRPVIAPVTRHFEPPPTPFAAGHRGIDFGAPFGTTVVATAAGTVAFAGTVGGSISVSVDHPNGLRSTYSFLSAVLVKRGQAVAQGTPVALSGPGAAGEAPNLHFGLRCGDEYLDPEPYLVASFRTNMQRVIRLAA